MFHSRLLRNGVRVNLKINDVSVNRTVSRFIKYRIKVQTELEPIPETSNPLIFKKNNVPNTFSHSCKLLLSRDI